MKKNKILVLVLLLPQLVFSQHFKYKCGIDTPDTTGFYSISITPEISSHTQIDLRDIRIVDNKGKWIPHVVKTSNIENSVSEASVENPMPSIKQLDSANWTLLQVSSKEPYQVDHLKFQVSRPAFYERIAKVYLQKSGGIVRTWQKIPFWKFKISSADTFKQPLPLVRTKEFYIIISNEDNPPLEISSMRTFQPQRELIAYLEKGKTYQLMLGDSNATAPNYDLKEFASNIPKNPKPLYTTDIVTLATMPSTLAANRNSLWIWVTIIGVIIILAYLTWHLTRDMSRNSEVS